LLKVSDVGISLGLYFCGTWVQVTIGSQNRAATAIGSHQFEGNAATVELGKSFRPYNQG
jgi:hypothetical protein